MAVEQIREPVILTRVLRQRVGLGTTVDRVAVAGAVGPPLVPPLSPLLATLLTSGGGVGDGGRRAHRDFVRLGLGRREGPGGRVAVGYHADGVCWGRRVVNRDLGGTGDSCAGERGLSGTCGGWVVVSFCLR